VRHRRSRLGQGSCGRRPSGQFSSGSPSRHARAENWISAAGLSTGDYLFPSRIHGLPHLSTRQHARLVH
jgi:hypothetical protein